MIIAQEEEEVGGGGGERRPTYLAPVAQGRSNVEMYAMLGSPDAATATEPPNQPSERRGSEYNGFAEEDTEDFTFSSAPPPQSRDSVVSVFEADLNGFDGGGLSTIMDEALDQAREEGIVVMVDKPLGLTLKTRQHPQATYVAKIKPGSNASYHAAIRETMVLRSINGQSVDGLNSSECASLVKVSPSPVELHFEQPTDGGAGYVAPVQQAYSAEALYQQLPGGGDPDAQAIDARRASFDPNGWA